MILSFCTVETLPQTLYNPSNDRPDGREIIRLHNMRLINQAQRAKPFEIEGETRDTSTREGEKINLFFSPSRLALRAQLNKRLLCRLIKSLSLRS